MGLRVPAEGRRVKTSTPTPSRAPRTHLEQRQPQQAAYRPWMGQGSGETEDPAKGAAGSAQVFPPGLQG